MKQFLKYTLATLCGLLLFGLLQVVFFFTFIGAIAGMSETTTLLEGYSVYHIRLTGTLSERVADDTFMSLLSQASGQETPQQLGLDDLLRNIRLAKENDNIAGIYLEGGNLSAGYASLQELRHALQDFKESGKFVVAYADNYSQSNYYLASVADSVYLNAHGSLSWSGLSSNVTFYSRALEKLGVEMQVVKVGTFKSAVEPYILTKMSEANRLQMKTMLDDIWDVVTTDVAQSRHVSVEQLNYLADRYLLLRPAEEIAASGLIDSLVYEQDMKKILSDLACFGIPDNYHLVSHRAMLKVPEAKQKYEKNKIAVIYAEGSITDAEGDGIVGKKMVETINKVADKDNVKAVVLRVNSPGGSAYASEQIWHALNLLKQKKPLIVSMGDYAASGGYYISCMADSIFLQENTLTGSIGIFGLIPNFAGLSRKLGIDYDGVSTHRLGSTNADMVLRGMNPEQRALMQGEINRGYELFVSRCAEGRKMTVAEIKAIAEGRVWSGQRAIEIGLADAVGDIRTAIAAAAGKAGLETYDIVTYPKLTDDLTKLMEALSGTSVKERRLLEQLRQIEQLAEQPSLQARLPFEISIK